MSSMRSSEPPLRHASCESSSGGSSETNLALARLVTHFLTALLVFILALLFVPR